MFKVCDLSLVERTCTDKREQKYVRGHIVITNDYSKGCRRYIIEAQNFNRTVLI